MKLLLCFSVLLVIFMPSVCAGEVIRLRAMADVWLSSVPGERNKSSGKNARLKLKTIQEMAAIRFDSAPAKGREVVSARLYLRRAGRDMLRYVRVSTVNQNWVEGNTERPHGPADGATYLYADHASKRPWAWPGSCFADVIMTSGNSLATWAECEKLENGWISVKLTPELIYAMAVDDTDGLAVMDGGNLTYHNNYVHSFQSPGSEPYVEVELGGRLAEVPDEPVVKAEPAMERAHLDAGAIKITIEGAENVFCWRVGLDGEQVERWRVKHPEAENPTVFYLEDLPPSREYELEVTAVSPGGQASETAKVSVAASPALSRGPLLGKLRELRGSGGSGMIIWAFPGLVKVSPETGEAMYADVTDDYRSANAAWDGERIRVFGARGEYVSYQLCVEAPDRDGLRNVRIRHQQLRGAEGATIGATEIELFKNWYARNRDEKWQPAYCIPLEQGAGFEIPDPDRDMPDHRNQSVYVDIYIPKNAEAGDYSGAVTIEADGMEKTVIPVELRVLDFALPDRLSFWPELNAYHVPRPAHAYYRLAHQHRCVLNCWRWAPKLQGSGKDIQVIWDEYDRNVGPLLTGEAFKGNRRSGVPVECMYLPFHDSWPTRLSKETYNYQGYWPGRGDDIKHIVEHYMSAPYIGDALSQDYKDAFLAVQRQFIQHFREKDWNQTEMQCFYGGKNTHRINYGSNMWWTTDEPYHWDDWLALQFFCQLWTKGRGNADRKQWPARADISRPQWQGRALDGIVNTVYFGAGAFGPPNMNRRCRILARETDLKLMTYGSANPDNESNTRSVVWVLNVWMNKGNGVLPWQTLGGDKALDENDRGAGGGNALLVPGERFGLEVVGDMRLKALREGQQIVEYMTILAERYDLRREQIRDMVYRAMRLEAGTRADAGMDDAEVMRFSMMKAWQISELRRRLGELIEVRKVD